MKKTLAPIVADSFCACLLVPKTRFNCRTTIRSTENGVGRPGKSVGRKRESIGGTREIGRETESCSGSSNSPSEPQRTVPPELQGLMADPSQLRTEREQQMQERLAERRRKMEEVQKMRVPALRRNQATAPSTGEAASPIPSPTPE